MELKRLGANMTELALNDGTRILVSYDTPVAAYVPCGADIKACAPMKWQGGWIKAERFFSRTTAAHIGKWIPRDVKARAVPAEELTQLMREAR